MEQPCTKLCNVGPHLYARALSSNIGERELISRKREQNVLRGSPPRGKNDLYREWLKRGNKATEKPKYAPCTPRPYVTFAREGVDAVLFCPFFLWVGAWGHGYAL